MLPVRPRRGRGSSPARSNRRTQLVDEQLDGAPADACTRMLRVDHEADQVRSAGLELDEQHPDGAIPAVDRS
jgi:hypothetical protein